ncbi:MAG: inositol monophosphatase [Opitutaceae bacterium]
MIRANAERLRRLLHGLQTAVRDALIAARAHSRTSSRFSEVAVITPADTIYRIDRTAEAAVRDWFERRWPRGWPVELVMEGLEDRPAVYPRGTPLDRTIVKCIVDPIDGTRGLMYDKRSAWVLTAFAPQRGARTELRDLFVAAMTELPTSRQTFSEQWSAIRGRGRRGVSGKLMDLRTGRTVAIRPTPSAARDCRHGFASLVKFFPEGRALTARIEEDLWRELAPPESNGSPIVFDDQYLTTGGQIRELLVGHDRMVGDVRPLVFRRLGLGTTLACHPYDLCAALVLTEAGGVVEDPEGGPVRAPLDTTSSVAWIGYANARLARAVRPALRRVLRRHLYAI